MYVFILTKCLLHMAALADGLKFFLLIAFNNHLILVETGRDWYIENNRDFYCKDYCMVPCVFVTRKHRTETTTHLMTICKCSIML